MSKKRLRESTQVNVALVEIYEDLAHENEEIRFKAAHRLLTKHIPDLDLDQVKNVLKRLFRGLCSGRKAARPGFAVALTETLFLLRAKRVETPDGVPSSSEIIDILEGQTTAEGNTRGQDERDHYFGRLFGVEAIIKSEILFNNPDLGEWNRLLDLVCLTATKKPWIRQEFGWILYNCVRILLKQNERQNFAVRILEKLNEHKLIRTPEGLAVWIEVQRSHPEARLPKHVWKHQHPMSRKDLQLLADVLRNAKSGFSDDTEFEVQGSATWEATLHFVWDVVLAELFALAEIHNRDSTSYVQDFWRVVVDEALLSPSSSRERRHWGLLVVQRTLETTPAPANLVGTVMSPRVVGCLIASLQSPDRYLQKSSERVLQTVRNCVTKSPEHGDVFILSILSGSGMLDFDAVTKTQTIHDLMYASSPRAMLGLAIGLNYELGQTNLLEPNEITRRRRFILNNQSKLISKEANEAVVDKTTYRKDVFSTILQAWIEISFGRSSFDETMKSLVREKIQLAFDQLLKTGKNGQRLMLDLIGDIYRCNTPVEIARAEAEIRTIVKAGWKRFEQLHDLVGVDGESAQNGTKEGPRNISSKPPKPEDVDQKLARGLASLYGLVLFEIHSGDTEAIQILRELVDLEADTKSKALGQGFHLDVDILVEMLLGFVSRPSKFLRRITLMIFEMITSHVTRNGLLSLTAILEAPETKSGQQDLFDIREEKDELASGDGEVEKDADIDMLDSDVEVVDASESGMETSDESESDSDSSAESTSSETSSIESESSEADDTEYDNADLLALEASLALALGTRKLTQDDKAAGSSSDSSSDADMSDSEMMALDDKLAEVFRNRASSSNESKKKEQKSAKESVVNFKNRVLDMLEVYIRQEHQNSQSLELILPLLRLSRQSRTKQLSDRAIKLLQMFFKRCSGLRKTPVLLAQQTNGPINGTSPSKSPDQETPSKKKKEKSKNKKTTSSQHPPPSSYQEEPQSSTNQTDNRPLTPSEALSILQEIHDEAGRPNLSNAHRTACSKSSILVAKTLLKAGVPFEDVAAVYDRTKARMEDKEDGDVDRDRPCHVHKGFFEDWDNWRVNVQDRF